MGTTPERWSSRAGEARALSWGAIELWRADLDRIDDGMLELLSSEEHARAERIMQERTRSRWMRSRALLRALLARRLHRDPRALRFLAAEHGKPILGGAAGLHFNLSHSGEVALVAVTTACEVGVDVELLGSGRGQGSDRLALAERLLGAERAAALAELDPSARERELLRAWTKREAIAKCLGSGLGVSQAPVEDDSEQLWQLELHLGAGLVGALAAQRLPRDAGSPPELRYRRWEDIGK